MPKEGSKDEVTLRLIGDGEASNITVKIHADYLKLVEKQKKAVTEYVLQDEDITEEETSSRLDMDASKRTRQEEPARVMIAEEVGKSTDDTFSFSEEGEDEEEEEDEYDEKTDEDEDTDEEEEEDDDWAKFMI